MQYTKTQDGYLLRLSKGEKIGESILSFCEKVGMHSGFFQALGGVSEAELGFYYLDKKEYNFTKVEGDHEVVSLTGNVSLVDNKPFVHMHAVLSDEHFSCTGGHLKEGMVSATFEARIVDFGKDVTREFDEEIGLKLLQCEIAE